MVYANGEEIARVKADNVMDLERALRGLPAPPTEALRVVTADKPVVFWRASEFWLLLVAATVAGFGVSGWVVIPACMAGLMLSSYGRRTRDQAHIPAWIMGLSSFVIATVAAVAAFVGGRVTWWFWGFG